MEMPSSKMPLTDRDGHLTKAFQKEKHDKSIAGKICEPKLESSLIKSLAKIDKFGSLWLWTSPDFIRHSSVQWRRSVAVSQHALMLLINAYTL